MAGNLEMQDDGATVGPAQRLGDEPEPCFPGRRGARVVQDEVASRAAQDTLDSNGRLESTLRERARGRPAALQVVDARPAATQRAAVFAGGLAPGLVSQDDRAVTCQHADPLGKGGEGKLHEFVSLRDLT